MHQATGIIALSHTISLTLAS